MRDDNITSHDWYCNCWLAWIVTVSINCIMIIRSYMVWLNTCCDALVTALGCYLVVVAFVVLCSFFRADFFLSPEPKICDLKLETWNLNLINSSNTSHFPYKQKANSFEHQLKNQTCPKYVFQLVPQAYIHANTHWHN